jgi:hypothetical protein
MNYSTTFKRIFESNPRITLSEQEIIKNFDNISESIYSKWIKIMEDNSIWKTMILIK